MAIQTNVVRTALRVGQGGVASDADEVAAASFHKREFDDSEQNGHGAETRRETIRLPRVVVSTTTTTRDMQAMDYHHLETSVIFPHLFA